MKKSKFALGSAAILLASLMAMAAQGGTVLPASLSDTASGDIANPALRPSSVSLADESGLVSDRPQGIDTAHADTVDGVLFKAVAARSSCAPGETLRLTYQIRNNSMGTVSYDFPSSCQFDLQVSDSKGVLVYSLLPAAKCAPRPSRITLLPGTEKSVELTAPLDLHKTDTLVVKPLMAGYPLSSVPVRILYRAGASAAPPSALEGVDRSKPVITFNNATKILTIRVSHPQRLSISAFVLTGKQVNKLSTEKFFSEGTHQISLNNRKLGGGIVIFKVEGPGFSESRTITLSP